MVLQVHTLRAVYCRLFKIIHNIHSVHNLSEHCKYFYTGNANKRYIKYNFLCLLFTKITYNFYVDSEILRHVSVILKYGSKPLSVR